MPSEKLKVPAVPGMGVGSENRVKRDKQTESQAKVLTV